MSNLLVIGDIHGKPFWEKPLLKYLSQGDTHIIFLGDYVDSFDIPAYNILNNFKNIINYKTKYPDKITLLLGNHDYAYIFGKSNTSGYNFEFAHDYADLFIKHDDLFEIAWGTTINEKYLLVTHAGLTNQWYKNILLPELDDMEGYLHKILDGDIDQPLHILLNYIKNKPGLLWKVGGFRGGSGEPGPLWADFNELIFDNYKGINQIVGHSAHKGITTHMRGNDILFCIDTPYNEVANMNFIL